MIDFTTVVGADAKYFEQLKLSAETWRKFRPEIWQQPLIVFCDRDASMEAAVQDWVRGTLGHRDANVVAWPLDNAGEYSGQAHKMLSGFAFVPAIYSKTQYWLKIDCDAIATGPSEWPRAEWFDGNPAIVASPWGYTKPAEQMGQLDVWANSVPGLKDFPPLNLPVEPGSRRCCHKRICSWVFFARTDWTREAAAYCPDLVLPVPSHDGYHFYIAKRRGDLIRPVSMKRHGWTNISRTRNLRKQVESIMQRTTD